MGKKKKNNSNSNNNDSNISTNKREEEESAIAAAASTLGIGALLMSPVKGSSREQDGINSGRSVPLGIDFSDHNIVGDNNSSSNSQNNNNNNNNINALFAHSSSSLMGSPLAAAFPSARSTGSITSLGSSFDTAASGNNNININAHNPNAGSALNSARSAGGASTISERDQPRSTVGIVLRGRIVDMVISGGPAEASGQVHAGDEILEVDGAPVNNQSILRAMKGPVGSPVTIKLAKAKDGRMISVVLYRTYLWGSEANGNSSVTPRFVGEEELKILMNNMGVRTTTESSVVKWNEFSSILDSNDRNAIVHFVTSLIAKEALLSQKLEEQSQNKIILSSSTDLGSDLREEEENDPETHETIERLRESLAAAEASRDSLEAEAVLLRAQLRREISHLAQVEIERARADMEQERQRLEALSTRLTKDLQATSHDLRAANESVSHLERQLSSIQEEKNAMQQDLLSQIGQWTSKNAAVTLALGAAEGRCEEQKITIERLLAELKAVRNDLAEKEREMMKLRGIQEAFKHLEIQSAADKQLIARLAADLERQRAGEKERQTIVENEHRLALGNANETIRTLEAEKAVLEEKLAEALKKAAANERQMRAALDTVQNLQHKLHLQGVEHEHAISVKNDRISSLEDSLLLLQQRLENSQQSEEQMTQTAALLAKLQRDLARSEERNLALTKENNELKLALEQRGSGESVLHDENEFLKHKIDSLQQQKREIEAELSRLMQLIKETEKRLQQEREESEENLLGRIKKLQEELFECRFRAEDAENKLREKEKQANLFQVIVTGKAGVGVYIEEQYVPAVTSLSASSSSVLTLSDSASHRGGGGGSMRLVIREIVPGGSAHRSKSVFEGDILSSIDGASTRAMTAQQAAAAIIGSQGTVCVLGLQRSESSPVRLVRLMRGTEEYLDRTEGSVRSHVDNNAWRIWKESSSASSVVSAPPAVKLTTSSSSVLSSLTYKTTAVSERRETDGGAWV